MTCKVINWSMLYLVKNNNNNNDEERKKERKNTVGHRQGNVANCTGYNASP